ncbi:WD domain-containing protein [Metarhizium album ARSEF 1941]|uniref:WD domain-containing protein n=1 Tax=Metarhizium album (strain ARSEF 1941) TaxID=1081103 RepID=A0A0B2X9K3_METAS|nr:WD domain-containing protein [Metarhizium album ARSEF 1941]KHO02001.1 WD domain-containing protein [Metarhizium album ARSEF 1941]
MVAKEFLDSDRVNFLIWRYLLEGDYRETAAKFQKEWHVNEPHRDFAFARHVKSRALVSIVNRGLIYHALEREYALGKLPRDAAGAETEMEVESLQDGVFGPLSSQQPAKADEGGGAAVGGDVEASRKAIQQQPQLPNGSPAKKPRLSNGYVDASASASASASAPAATAATTSTTTTSATTPMDIDSGHHQHPHPHPHPPPLHTPLSNSHDSQHDASNNHAYPSPLEGEQLPPPIIHTDGPEQGTQVDKVEELSPDTTFIRLLNDEGPPPKASEATATPSPSPSPVGAENAPVLLQCEWNPRDPSMLAAAGTDALARVWTICRSSAGATTDAKDGRDHVAPVAKALIDPDSPRTTTVTAMSWMSDGTAIALATESGSAAAVSVWSAGGVHMQTMDVSEPPVIKLSWNPSNTALLAISPEKGGALLTVYSSAHSTVLTYVLPGHDIGATPLDAAWTNDAEFLLGGGDLLLCLDCTAAGIVQARKFEAKEDDSFTQVLFDWRSKLAATSSDKGTLDLWDESGQRRSITAHQGAITTMAWQPLPPSQATPDDERLIATGGDDCAILIWNARKPESKAKCFLTMDSPIVRLAFTPDGAFIAGATSRQVLIWKVDNHTMPRASWNRPPHPGWLSPNGSSESDEEDEHCMCWDVSGQKLAYGSNSRVSSSREVPLDPMPTNMTLTLLHSLP